MPHFSKREDHKITLLVVGGALNIRATNALGQTDEEKTPTTDSWQTAKSQIALFADARVKRAAARGRGYEGRVDALRQGQFRRGRVGGGRHRHRSRPR